MATIPINPENLRLGTGAGTSTATAGETITPFQLIYRASDGKVMKAVNTTADEAALLGVAMTYAALDGQIGYIPISEGADVILNSNSADFTKGDVYVISSTAGQMEPAADLTTGDFCTVCAFAVSTTQLQMHNVQTGLEA
mgnify:CR=1 FL=1|tara:strand:+ start:36 stop:455 length:420 start_codon:yes stop_codon:yes gene_type:complete